MVEIPDREYQRLLDRLKELESSAFEHERPKEIMALESKSQRVRAEIAKLSMMDIDRKEAINCSLALLGRFLHVSRVCLQLIREGGKVAVTDYEWREKGIKSTLGTRFKAKEGGWITKAFREGGIVKIDASHIENLPRIGRMVMKLQGVKSFFGVPFHLYGKLEGFFSLNECVKERIWKDEEIALFKDAARLIELILERKQVEEEIKKSESRYRLLFDSSADILVQIDEKGKIIDANRRVLDIAGYRKEDVVGRKISALSDMFTKKSVALMAANFIKRKLGIPINVYEVEGRDVGGRPKFYEIRAAVLKTSDGENMGELAILHDITERRQAEELLKKQTRGLEEANEKLRELDRMKSNFLSNVSHELRTPLASIKGFTETIIREKDMDENNRQEFLNIIKEESDKLSTLINRLLNLSRLEIGKVKLKKEKIDLVAVIREVIASFGTQARLKELTLIGELPKNLPPIYADPENIKEVLAQLLDNSIKYTEKEGTIRVSVRDQDRNILVSVADTGVGIPGDMLPHIFDMFYKVERPAEQAEGIGMGMALVKYIVEAHGGRIKAESEVGKGSEFIITLPRG
jgi:PAS domain S-box-containing protein